MQSNNLKLASWNVNGIRAVTQKRLTSWLHSGEFDVLAVQEIEHFEDQFPAELLESDLYDVYVLSQKRRIFRSRIICKKIVTYRKLLPPQSIEYDDEGRVQIAEFEKFILFNCYLPNGARDHSRVLYKLACSQATLELARKLKKSGKSACHLLW